MTAFAAGPHASPRPTVLVGEQLSAIDDDARLVLEHVGAYIALEDARRVVSAGPSASGSLRS
jgi:hypothetical protein